MFDGILGIIETLLVLSLTFVVLATAASSVAGIFLRFTRRRARGYRNTIEFLFRNDISPAVKDIVDTVTTSVPAGAPTPDLSELKRFYDPKDPGHGEARLQFIADIAMNPVPVKGGSDRDPRLDIVMQQSEGATIWSRWLALKHVLSGATPADFRTRFRGSEVGKRLLATEAEWGGGDARAFEKLLDRIAFQFEAHASGATDWFKGVARQWSIPVGFLIAFGLNIDTIDLFKTYMQSPSARSEILKKQDEILSGKPGAAQSAADKKNRAKREESFAALEKKLAALKADAAVMDAGPAKDKMTKMASELNDTLVAARAATAETAQIIQSLQSSFPIGWERYPTCLLPDTDRRCSSKLKDSRRVRVQWIIGLIITGLLMGLGAPFWVEMANNMLQSRKLVMSFKGIIPGKKK